MTCTQGRAVATTGGRAKRKMTNARIYEDLEPTEMRRPPSRGVIVTACNRFVNCFLLATIVA